MFLFKTSYSFTLLFFSPFTLQKPRSPFKDFTKSSLEPVTTRCLLGRCRPWPRSWPPQANSCPSRHMRLSPAGINKSDDNLCPTPSLLHSIIIVISQRNGFLGDLSPYLVLPVLDLTHEGLLFQMC